MNESYVDQLGLMIHRTRKLAQLVQDATDDGICYGELFTISEAIIVAHHRLECVAEQLELEMPPTVEEVMAMSPEELDLLDPVGDGA